MFPLSISVICVGSIGFGPLLGRCIAFDRYPKVRIFENIIKGENKPPSSAARNCLLALNDDRGRNLPFSRSKRDRSKYCPSATFSNSTWKYFPMLNVSLNGKIEGRYTIRSWLIVVLNFKSCIASFQRSDSSQRIVNFEEQVCFFY